MTRLPCDWPRPTLEGNKSAFRIHGTSSEARAAIRTCPGATKPDSYRPTAIDSDPLWPLCPTPGTARWARSTLVAWPIRKARLATRPINQPFKWPPNVARYYAIWIIVHKRHCKMRAADGIPSAAICCDEHPLVSREDGQRRPGQLARTQRKMLAKAKKY